MNLPTSPVRNNSPVSSPRRTFSSNNSVNGSPKQESRFFQSEQVTKQITIDQPIVRDDQYEVDVPISVFAKTGHFFHGKLIQLQNYVTQMINS